MKGLCTVNNPENSRSNSLVTIVVGGMHGIGKNTARMFYRAGHNVIIVDKQPPPEGENECLYSSSFQADLTQIDSISDVITKVSDNVCHISNLIFTTRYRGHEDKAWDEQIILELTAVKMMIEGFFPLMKDNGGSIVLTSSTAARFITSDCTVAYHVVKAAVEQMTRFYAVELGPKQIRVNAIAPGYIVKDESIPYFIADEKRSKSVENNHPLRRYGRADDVANTVLFLCDKAASFITGQIITVDGGLSLHNPGF